MKKFLIMVGLLMLCATPVLAEEGKEDLTVLNTDKPVQGLDVEKSGAVIVLQKQPQADTSVQYVRIRKCGLVAIIHLNGKVKETETK